MRAFPGARRIRARALLLAPAVLLVLAAAAPLSAGTRRGKTSAQPAVGRSGRFSLQLVSQEWGAIGAGQSVRSEGESRILQRDLAGTSLVVDVVSRSDRAETFDPSFFLATAEGVGVCVFSAKPDRADAAQLTDPVEVPARGRVRLLLNTVYEAYEKLEKRGSRFGLRHTAEGWIVPLEPLPSRRNLYRPGGSWSLLEARLLDQRWHGLRAGSKGTSEGGATLTIQEDLVGVQIRFEVFNPCAAEVRLEPPVLLIGSDGEPISPIGPNFSSPEAKAGDDAAFTLKPGQRTVFAFESGMEAYAEIVEKQPLSIRAEKHGWRWLLSPIPPHPRIFKE